MREGWWRAALWIAVPLATIALALMPLLTMRAMVAVIAIWILVLVLRAITDPLPMGRARLGSTLLLAAPFLLMLLDLGRAEDLLSAWKHVERSASLILFPIGFLLLGAPASRRSRETLQDLFSISALALAIRSNIAMAFTDLPAGIATEPGHVYNYRALFGLVTGIHPPYAAYYFFLAAIFQVVRALDDAPHRILRAVSAGSLFIAGVLLASRMPLFAFASALALVAIMRMPRRKAMQGLLGLSAGLALTMILSPGLRQRTSEAVRFEAAPISQSEVTSTNIRLSIAHCSAEAIGDHWLLGTGQVNAQSTLDDCYRRFNIPLLLDGSYGTHNQFLHWWLCFGITGAALFVLFFGALFRHAWRTRDTAHLAFLVFLVLCMITENLLARQWGVVLFACFNTLFVAGSLCREAGDPDRAA